MGKLFKKIQKLNTFATTLDDENILAKIKGYISTGVYAINAIFSADLFGGIPKGRITTLFGPSQSGKSFISALLQKSAVEEENMEVVIFDTEFDKDGRMEISLGVDPSKVMTVPIESIEELTIQSTKMLDDIVNDPEEHGKYLFILDSLGFLASNKQIEDALKEGSKANVASDMGAKAKLIKQWQSNIKGKVAKSGCAFLIINHEIANPGQQYESVFKDQGGGQGTVFVSTVMAHVSAKKEKQDKSNELDVETIMTKANYTGQHIRVFTQKNRCAIPHKEAEVYLNFATGINKYSGLDPFLDMMGDILYTKDAKGEVGKGYNYYLKDGDEEIKLGKKKEWVNNKEAWDKILPRMNEIVKRELAYRAHE